MTQTRIVTDLNLMSLVEAVAIETHQHPADVHAVVQTTLDVIGRAVAEGHRVKLNNFGTFEPGTRDVPAGALGGRVTEPMTVRVVRFRLSGRLLGAVRARIPVDTLRRAAKSP